jgi:predicted MPP superfamily phosphohydrolase
VWWQSRAGRTIDKRRWILGTEEEWGAWGTIYYDDDGRLRVDPNTLSRDADFRILLCHYPNVLDRLQPGRFELVLAGHMHDGQIALPYPGGKVRLAHLRARYARGVYRRAAAVMHVSPGLGTTFVPFRFAARPEATELVLRSPRG